MLDHLGENGIPSVVGADKNFLHRPPIAPELSLLINKFDYTEIKVSAQQRKPSEQTAHRMGDLPANCRQVTNTQNLPGIPESKYHGNKSANKQSSELIEWTFNVFNIREMPIKITLRYRLTPDYLSPNIGEDVKRDLNSLLVEGQVNTAIMEISLEFLQKV